MTEKEKKYAIILASLIYDIGVLYKSVLKNEDNLIKLSKKFFEENIARKTCVTPIKEYVEKILNLEETERFKSILDAERIYLEAEKVDIKSTKLSPLYSVLQSVDFEKSKENKSNDKFVYLPHKLDLENIFPKKESEINDEIFINELAKVFNEFVNDIKLLPDSEISAFVDSLLYLYEKYLTYVSSAALNDTSDISLFDHSKTVAALSVCKEFAENSQNPFLIITADISGIQSFIYAEKESKSKRLRGRSFYLSLLTDVFSTYLLKKFDLSRTNILMNGGGHFVMIVPNNEKNKKILDAAKQKINKWFYENYKGELNLVIAELEANEELYKNFPKWYDEISGKLIKAKKQKNVDTLTKIFNYNLDAADFSEYLNLLTQEQREEINNEITGYEKNLKILDFLFEQIGGNLPKTNYLIEIYSENEKPSVVNNSKDDLLVLPFAAFNLYYVFSKLPSGFIVKNKERSFNGIRILKINDTNYFENEITSDLSAITKSNIPYTFGFTFLGKYTPTEDNDGQTILEFEKLAESNKEDNSKLNHKLLGTLRMDVDNLGAIFSQGLDRNEGETIRTLSRTVSLSREFNLFFGGYLNKIAKDWDIYITYSGGDDLFIVGSWINSMNFAQKVKEDFTRFTCNNPYLTISGGLFIHKHNFPIGRAAEQAGEAETKAKHTIISDKEKDNISVFDKVFNWETFNKHFEYGKALDAIVDKEKTGDDNKIKSGYLHFLLQRSKELFDEDGNFSLNNYFRIISKIKYYLARGKRGITYKEIEKIQKGEEGISDKIKLLAKLINEKEYLENFVLSASYVILKNRDK